MLLAENRIPNTFCPQGIMFTRGIPLSEHYLELAAYSLAGIILLSLKALLLSA
jgi:hypothetical protein